MSPQKSLNICEDTFQWHNGEHPIKSEVNQAKKEEIVNYDTKHSTAGDNTIETSQNLSQATQIEEGTVISIPVIDTQDASKKYSQVRLRPKPRKTPITKENEVPMEVTSPCLQSSDLLHKPFIQTPSINISEAEKEACHTRSLERECHLRPSSYSYPKQQSPLLMYKKCLSPPNNEAIRRRSSPQLGEYYRMPPVSSNTDKMKTKTMGDARQLFALISPQKCKSATMDRPLDFKKQTLWRMVVETNSTTDVNVRRSLDRYVCHCETTTFMIFLHSNSCYAANTPHNCQDTAEASYNKKDISKELSDMVIYTETVKFTGFKVE